MPGFGVRGTLAGVAVVVVLLGGLLWAAAGHSASAHHPRMFGGSLVLEDHQLPTVIDLATGRVMVRLQGVYADVRAPKYQYVQPVPAADGTFLVNTINGTFNLLGKDNYIVDRAGLGVGLGTPPGSTAAAGFADGADAYIVQYGATTGVRLVDEATVRDAQALGAAVPRTSSTHVPLPGSAVLGGPVLNKPGSVVVSSGALWALVGAPGGACRIMWLHPAPGRRNGTLSSAARGTFGGGCKAAAAGAAGSTVGVATPGHVRLFRSDGRGRGRVVNVASTGHDGVLLPVTGGTSTLWFLGEGPSGWSVFGVTPRGGVVAPAHLASFPKGAQPAQPVESEGRLYTLDTHAAHPVLWEIAPRTGAMSRVLNSGGGVYPLLSEDVAGRVVRESPTFGSTQVIADGPRVVFNNPAGKLAVVVFTDGFSRPLIVNKSEAVVVSATGPAKIGVGGVGAGRARATSPTTSPVPVQQAVSQQVTCATTSEKPYVPQVEPVAPSTESALIAWRYTLLDQTDCEPNTWSVRVTALTGSHQPNPSEQVVNGQNQILFTGLRPATVYQAVVTAWLNKQSTASEPVTFRTAPQGPDAPTAVHTASDGKGDWIVSWTPCTAAGCYVPADTWTVIGAACGSGYVGQPPTVQVPAGQTTARIDAAAAQLLGARLSFSVEGSLYSGLAGPPTSDHACTEAWRAPNPAAIHVAGSGVPSGQTITATVEVSTTGSAADAFGSTTTDFVYHLGGVTLGPVTSPRVTIPGLQAGVAYTPVVTVYPAGHPAASVTITGAPFTQNLAWPSNLAVGVTGRVDPQNPNQGSLDVTFPGVPSGPMTAAGTVTCGSTATGVGGTLSAGSFTYSPFDLDTMGGSCRLDVTVSDTATPDPYGTASPQLTTDFVIGTQPAYAFSAAFVSGCGALGAGCGYPLTVGYAAPASGPAQPAGINWTVDASAPGATSGCNATWQTSGFASFPVVLALPYTCSDTQLGSVAVTVRWEYLGASTPTPWTGSTGGTPVTTTTTAPTTTTTAPTTTTPATTAPATTTTTPPPPTTGPATTIKHHGSTTVAVQAALAGFQSGAAAREPAAAGDPLVRDALAAAFLACAVASLAGVAGGMRRRRDRKGAR